MIHTDTDTYILIIMFAFIWTHKTYFSTDLTFFFILLLKLVVSHKIKTNGSLWNYIMIQGWLDCWISLDKHLGQWSYVNPCFVFYFFYFLRNDLFQQHLEVLTLHMMFGSFTVETGRISNYKTNRKGFDKKYLHIILFFCILRSRILS